MQGRDLVGVELFVLLLAVAVAVALVTRRLSIPYSVALVVAGLGISLTGPIAHVEITPELILAVLIPGL
jgi:CPA1 family monovalent cation:H+ antiporter